MFVEGSGEGEDDYGSAREREAGVRGSIAMRPFRETLFVMCVCVVGLGASEGALQRGCVCSECVSRRVWMTGQYRTKCAEEERRRERVQWVGTLARCKHASAVCRRQRCDVVID